MFGSELRTERFGIERKKGGREGGREGAREREKEREREAPQIDRNVDPH